MNNDGRPTWIRFHLNKWELLTYKLPPADFHAYARLFFVSTYTDGRLPLNSAAAAKVSGLPEQIVKKVVAQNPQLFEIDGEWTVVRHAAQELLDSDNAKNRSEHARRAAMKRWHPRVIEGGDSNG